jgi:hypothetical protein
MRILGALCGSVEIFHASAHATNHSQSGFVTVEYETCFLLPCPPGVIDIVAFNLMRSSGSAPRKLGKIEVACTE